MLGQVPTPDPERARKSRTPTYMFYGVDRAGCRTSGRPFLCNDDVEALTLAETMLTRFSNVEVWRDGVMVGALSVALSERAKGLKDG